MTGQTTPLNCAHKRRPLFVSTALKMRVLGALFACGAAIAGCGGGGDGEASSDWGDTPRVKIAQGSLQGDVQGGSVRFLQIPYAAPPVGALRWKAPAPAPAWSGTRHMSAFSSACAQQMSAQGKGSESEDCLYLNVWTPREKPKNAAVMVWIHGGGNFAGGAGDLVPDPVALGELPLFYDGQTLAAREGVVVVTLNYRLGPFGFFSHPALGSEGSPLGNQGLLDQQQALRWVKENIEAFGGDPGNVTIFGESAGSADVCYHVVSPTSRGLFHRAISESGGCTVSPTGSRDEALSETAPKMQAFAAAAGCASDAPLACLRGLTPAQILSHAEQPNPAGNFFAEPAWRFSVVVDGDGGFLPRTARDQFARGDVAKVPYILGSNADEGTLFTLTTSVSDAATYMNYLTEAYGDLAPGIAAVYTAEKFGGDYRAALARVVGDAGLGCGTHDTARRARAAGLPVFMYMFNVPWKVSFGILGAAHASEVSHVFGNPYRADATDERVSTEMTAYWASFARSGDPNHAGAAAMWPAFAPTADDRDMRLELASTIAPLADFRREECAFWRTVYESKAAQ
jgi:para-nitrobenzyl esterase